MSFGGKILSKSKGFSFTEMSVVLASVAAVIVLTTSGVSLLKKSEIQNVISDIGNFKNSISKFEQKYSALPGDIGNTESLIGATAGNGNGVIDTPAEAINLWRHLSISGLISNNYDGSSIYKPGKGVPAADIEGGGYKITLAANTRFNNDAENSNDIPDQALIIELAGFSSSSNSMPILTTEDAKIIDEVADDGNPLTGNILAEGSNNDCVSGTGDYNLSEKIASCRMLFIVKSGKASSDAPEISGACNELGQTRQISDFSKKCPQGYEGIIIETCRVSSDNQGVWEITDQKCVEVKCSGGGSYGESRRLSCINDMVGTEGIVEQCTENGIWKVIRSDCKYRNDLACKTNGEIRKAQACDWGKAGFLLQTCTNNKWNVPSTLPNFQCSNMKCGINNIGDTQTSSNCGTNYTGQVVRICTVAGTWEETSIGSTCAPTYGTCNPGSDSTKEMGCAPGKEGSHIVKCINNGSNDYWTTISNTCEPIQCSGGQNIGSVRVKEGASCPNNTNGQVMEYCDETGAWQEVLTNCVVGICEAAKDNKGNAYWPTSIGNTLNVNATSCVEGYKISGATPTRDCNSDGTWSETVNDPCVRITCDSPFNNATYPVTAAGEKNITGICDSSSGYSAQAQGYPISDCKIDGTWDNERIPCQANLLLLDALVWLDGTDDSTIFVNDNCTSAASPGNPVGCWMDKSGNNNHFLRGLIDYNQGLDSRPTYTSNDTVDIGPGGFDHDRLTTRSNFIYHSNDGMAAYAVAKSVRSYPTSEVISFGGMHDLGYQLTYSLSHVAGRIGSGSLYNNQGGGQMYGHSFDITSLGKTSNDFSVFGMNIGFQENLIVRLDGTTKINFPISTIKLTDDEVAQSDYSQVFSGPVSIGASTHLHSVGSASSEGEIGEIVVYDRKLSEPDILELEDYLGDKWGVTMATDSLPVTSATQVLWLDATDSDTVRKTSDCNPAATNRAVAGTDSVGCWQDKSGTGNDATIGSSNEPDYISSGINSLASISFTASNGDYFNLPNMSSITEGEIFIVFQKNYNLFYDYPGHTTWSDNHATGFWHFGASSSSAFRAYNDRIFDNFGINGNEWAQDQIPNLTNPILYNVVAAKGTGGSTNQWSNKINGEPLRSFTNPATIGFSSSPTLGKSNCTPCYYEGKMGEVVMYNNKLSRAQRMSMESYLALKWGITLP